MKILNQYKKPINILISFMILILAGCNMDQHITPEEIVITETDEVFVTDATYINLIGIEYGQLAIGKSQTGMILAYANRIIEEQAASTNRLEAIAGDLEVATPEAVLPEIQAHQDQLAQMEGSAFDSLYIQRKIETYLWAQDIMEEYISVSNLDVLTEYARQELLQINLRLDDALMIQSELQ